MTDLEKFCALMTEFGVVYEADEDDSGHCLTLEAKSCEKIVGYYGFFALFSFDADGKFEDVGIWE